MVIESTTKKHYIQKTQILILQHSCFSNTISINREPFICSDIKNMYLVTLLDTPEYFHIPIRLNPQKILQQYNLLLLVHNENIYWKADNKMYRTPQAESLASKLLKKRLEMYWYKECTTTTKPFQHGNNPVIFLLVMNDFGLNALGEYHVQHLINTLKKH